MAVSKFRSHTPFRNLRMLLFKAILLGPTNSRPQFITKGPPISGNNSWVMLAIGLMLTLLERGVCAIASERKRAKLAVKGLSNLGATGKAPNRPS